ncbi:MAG: PQQ-binding-like beta-propeller repeat protein [Planctomycetota bacterium]|nr:PQQ-binding-like beta-propeller repeat protein [Planctomycetota bacterium]
MPHGPRIALDERHSHRFGRMLAGCCLLGMIIASATTATPSEQETEERLARQQAVRDHLEQSYLVGPAAAESFGYTVDWQFPVPSGDVDSVTSHGDRIFVVTGNNDLICLQADNGRRIWTVSVADDLEIVHSITYMPEQELVLVLTNSKLVTLDSNTGMTKAAVLGKAHQELQWIANTPGVLSGDHLIYGARNGQLVWQTWKIGFAWKAYQAAGSLRLPPVQSNNIICTTSSDGVVSAFNADTAGQMWNARLLDGIVAEAAASDHAVYVAGIDQHLRAFDIRSGRTLWRVLTESALVDPPTLIGDRLYQQIPGLGLACFDALPVNKLDGDRKWLCPDNNGTVVARHGDTLVTWDATNKVLSTVSATQGTPIHSRQYANIDEILTTRLQDGKLLAVGDDGRLICLDPMR